MAFSRAGPSWSGDKALYTSRYSRDANRSRNLIPPHLTYQDPRLSLDPRSRNSFVRITKPNTWVHSERILPTTCPHFLWESTCRYSKSHPIPIISRNTLKECRCKNLCVGDEPRGRLLSAEPTSNKLFVARTVSRECRSNRQLHSQRMNQRVCSDPTRGREKATSRESRADTRLKECSWKNPCSFVLCPLCMQHRDTAEAQQLVPPRHKKVVLEVSERSARATIFPCRRLPRTPTV